MRRTLQIIALTAAIPAALALGAASAEAQRPARGGGGAVHAQPSRPAGGGHVQPGRRTVIVSGYGYYGYPYWGWGWGGFWDPFWWGGPWGYPYGYWGRGYYDDSAEIRLEVKPKEAQVYVDGYYAGVVDDFDGVFQRLHVRPGDHELVVYLQGFRSLKQNLHVGQDQNIDIKDHLQPVAAGEQTEPPPQPTARPEPQAAQPAPYEAPRPIPRHRPAEAAPAPVQEEGAAAEGGSEFGSLVIRVQPSGADILIDGERWQGPEASERLVVQVSAGPHRIEVRKDGFVPFTTTINVRRGQTAPLNVSLPKQ